MQVWIDQNLPGASLGNYAAYDILCTDFKRYLTDFGVGFVYGGGEDLLQFTVNTVSGEIILTEIYRVWTARPRSIFVKSRALCRKTQRENASPAVSWCRSVPKHWTAQCRELRIYT
jgi:hypothetical protein